MAAGAGSNPRGVMNPRGARNRFIRRRRRLLSEQLEPRHLLALDFGDAPAPFPTSLAEDGARHEIAGPRLGGRVDGQLVGVPAENADADPDDDGVQFADVRVGNGRAHLTVDVQNAAGRLDAWVDFDADGSWSGAREQIFRSIDVTPGMRTLRFEVPPDAQPGETFARVRISTDGGLGVGGPAPDGEVEDFRLLIEPAVEASAEFGSSTFIRGADYVSAVHSSVHADFNGDGHLDIVASYTLSGRETFLYRFQNSGSGSFAPTRYDVGDGSTIIKSMDVGDLDGDGDLDIVGLRSEINVDISRRDPDQLVWLKNVGGTFSLQVLESELEADVVHVADLDQDGRLDLLLSGGRDRSLRWYRGTGAAAFTETTIAEELDGRSTTAIQTGDVDRDGDLDVLVSAGKFGVTPLIWYINNGTQQFTPQVMESVGGYFTGKIALGDFNSDGFLDVVRSDIGTQAVALHLNDGTGESFTRHHIDTSYQWSDSFAIGDVNGDGHLDIVTHIKQKIRSHLNRGDGTFDLISRASSTRVTGLGVGDLDRDGDLDVIIRSTASVGWFPNELYDYGDAPAPYPTTFQQDGARHVDEGPMLGSRRDGELNGLPSEQADGDGDDDDGVRFGELRVGDTNATITVEVTGGEAYLNGWIDFEGDGSWRGEGEHVIRQTRVTSGFHSFEIPVPVNAKPGETYARFRLSRYTTYVPTGPRLDGEVEDYLVTIEPAVSGSGDFAAGIPFQSTISLDELSDAIPVDYDGDGDLDLVTVSDRRGVVAWHENHGQEYFRSRNLASGSWQEIAVGDLDRDGKPDVIAADQSSRLELFSNNGTLAPKRRALSEASRDVTRLQFYTNGTIPGVYAAEDYDGRIEWYALRTAPAGTWTDTIASTTDGVEDFLIADLDADGTRDYIAAEFYRDQVVWYEKLSDAHGAEQVSHVLATDIGGAKELSAVDLDRDGDLDLVVAAYDDDAIYWLENVGDKSFTKHVLASDTRGIQRIEVVDMDGDGDMDVVSASASSDEVVVHFNDGGQIFSPHVVSDQMSNVRALAVGDFTQDGVLDIVASTYRSGELFLFAQHPKPTQDSDFGDAPAPYPTLHADGGAFHGSDGPRLGQRRDGETDGRPNPHADADVDDDGVSFGEIRVGDLVSTATIEVTGSGGKVDAWIDFNGDGSWGGPGERILSSVDVTVGIHELTFAVPDHALAGETFARVRISTAGGLGQTGFAIDGEVEDYSVTVLGPKTTQEFLPGAVVGNIGSRALYLTAGDIDADRDVDLVASLAGTAGLRILHQDAFQSFQSSAAERQSRYHQIADLNRDGRSQIIAAASPAGLFDVVPDGGSYSVLSVPGIAASIPRFAFADIDHDGDDDIVSARNWYENVLADQYPVSDPLLSYDAEFVQVADMDHDGDLDIVAGNHVITLDDAGDRESIIEFTDARLREGQLLDFDGDGDQDVVAIAYSDGLAFWFEQTGTGTFVEHLIHAGTHPFTDIVAFDADGDGDQDVATMQGQSGRLVLHRNQGDGSFDPHVLHDFGSGIGGEVLATDIDQDGDLDLLATEYREGDLYWFENVPPPSNDIGDAPRPYYRHRALEARHQAVGPRLGESRTVEHTLPRNPQAASDDDDGVSFGIVQVGAAAATVEVTVTDGPAILDAWIDFEADGSWGGAHDQIFHSVELETGTHELSFSVPVDATPETTYARFRLSTSGGLSPYGSAEDGEVEDYAVAIESTTPSIALFDAPLQYAPFGLEIHHVTDVDRDGELDVIGIDKADGAIAWLAAGASGFSRVVIDAEVSDVGQLSLADLDGNGNLDVLAVVDGVLVTYLEDDGAFLKTPVPHNFGTVKTITLADFDVDGDLDVLATTSWGISLYQNDSQGNLAATVFESFLLSDVPVLVFDFDHDGDLDVVSAYGESILWHEQLAPSEFVPQTFATLSSPISQLLRTSIRSPLPDLVAIHGATATTIVQTGTDTAQVSTDLGEAVDHVALRDLTGNGADDLVVFRDGAARYRPDRFWGFSSFEHEIGTGRGTFTDVDGDGDLDFLENAEDASLVWRENVDADFGDAPDPYATRMADDGARHDAKGPRLGESREVERDALTIRHDDDDGVMFGDLRVGESMAGVNIDLRGGDAAVVDAWLDFNGDGVWQAEERILRHAPVIAGLQTLNFPLPEDVRPIEAYARVRLTTDGIDSPTGLAADGEVEDYLLAITQSITVDLPVDQENRIQVLRQGEKIEIRELDGAEHTVLAAYHIAAVDRLAINGGDHDDEIIIDYGGGGFDFRHGVHVDGGAGTDRLTVRGNLSVNATLIPTDGELGEGLIEAAWVGTRARIHAGAIEPIDVVTVNSIRVDGDLTMSHPLHLDSVNRAVLGGSLHVDEIPVVTDGGLRLGGTLAFSLPADADPVDGDRFLIAIAEEGYAGHFDELVLPPTPAGAFFELNRLGPELWLEYVELPTVVDVRVGDGAQRSNISRVEVEINGDVTIYRNAFVVTRRNDGAVVPSDLEQRLNAAGNTIATLTFSGDEHTRGASGMLIDGNYELMIDSSRVVRRGKLLQLDGDRDNQAGGDFRFGANAADGFFAHFGDTDGDRDVDGLDFTTLSRSFLRSNGDAGFHDALDYDRDGDVDGADYARFVDQFLRVLTY